MENRESVFIALDRSWQADDTATYLFPGVQLADLGYPDKIRRIAMNTTPGYVAAALVPESPFLFSAQRAATEHLRKSGFKTGRVGLVIIAYKQLPGSGRHDPVKIDFKWSDVGSAARKAVFCLLSRRLPARPLLIGRIGADRIAFSDETLYILATVRSEGMNLFVAGAGSGFFYQPGVAPPPVGEEELLVALHSKVLSVIPEELRRGWNNSILAKLGFVETKPDIINYLGRINSRIIIDITEENATIAAVDKSGDFVSTAKDWVQQEERHTRPRRRAFRLPDGTLGYEMVPGQIRSLFVDIFDSGGCRRASFAARKASKQQQGQEIEFWLCAADGRVALGSSRDMALSGVKELLSPQRHWRVVVGTAYLEKTALFPLFRRVSARGFDDKAVLSIDIDQ